jgi:hypothetical protein
LPRKPDDTTNVVTAIPLTPTPINEDIVSISSMSFIAFAYGDNDKGYGNLSIINNENSETSYMADYSLPDQGDGYAGIAFRFSAPQNLSIYKYVEVTIIFDDEQASCDFAFRDFNDKIDNVRLGATASPRDDITVDVKGKEQTIKIPLATGFSTIKLNGIKEIGFNTGTHFTRGNHSFTVNGIKFLKN